MPETETSLLSYCLCARAPVCVSGGLGEAIAIFFPTLYLLPRPSHFGLLMSDDGTLDDTSTDIVYVVPSTLAYLFGFPKLTQLPSIYIDTLPKVHGNLTKIWELINRIKGLYTVRRRSMLLQPSSSPVSGMTLANETVVTGPK